jgi:hypothetical protein
MAIVYTYPIGTPAAGDLLVGTKTPVEGEAFEPKTTLNFTVSSLLSLGINGTVGTIPVFTGTNTVGNSIITQSASNIGIGTTSPSAKLNVNGDIKIEGTSSLSFGGTASVPAWGINSSGSDLIINDQAATTGDVLFTNAGNVGIGTNAPSQKLHVDGAVRVTGGYYDSSNSQGTSGKVLSSTGSGTSWVDTISGPGLADRVVRWTGSNTITSSSIRDNGTNVAIGQSNAGDENLTVGSGTGSGIGGLFIKDPFAGGSRFVSSKNPMLSLGTATVTGATSTIFMGSASTATAQDSKIEYDRGNSGDAKLSIWFKGQGTYREHLRFGDISNSTPRSVFFGNVGINTTSPTAQLDVNGTIAARTGIKLFSGSNEVLQMFPSGGTNVYINTSTSGGTINFGAPAANTTNIDVQGKATAEELESTTSSKGLILKSPDGTRYRVTVANGGTLSVSAV